MNNKTLDKGIEKCEQLIEEMKRVRGVTFGDLISVLRAMKQSEDELTIDEIFKKHHKKYNNAEEWGKNIKRDLIKWKKNP